MHHDHRNCNCGGNDYMAIITGSLIGAAVGAVTALLLAPHSGEQTRTMLRREGKRVAKYLGNTAQEWEEENVRPLVKQAKKRVDEVRGRIDDTVSSTRKRAEALRDDVIDAAEDARKRAAREL